MSEKISVLLSDVTIKGDVIEKEKLDNRFKNRW